MSRRLVLNLLVHIPDGNEEFTDEQIQDYIIDYIRGTLELSVTNLDPIRSAEVDKTTHLDYNEQIKLA